MKLTSNQTIVLSGNSVVARSMHDQWGWLPILSLTSAAGVFLVALAYNGGRFAVQGADLLFWLAMIVLFLPIAIRLFLARPTRGERIALLIVLGIAFYLVKYLQYPLYFAYYDEFVHWRGSLDILTKGHLFFPNTLLPIGTFYPGLEIVTSTISSLTGLSVFASGMLVIGVARLVCILALYLFFEYVSGSTRVAGIATLLYMVNAGFIFTDGMFAYESLALPLSVFVIYAIARRNYVHSGHNKGLTLVIWLALAAVVVTHHVTSYALVAFLLLWTIVWLWIAFHNRRSNSHQKNRTGPGGTAILGIAMCVAWFIFTGGLAFGYLTPHLFDAAGEFVRILHGQEAIRQLFHSNGNTGTVFPLWERIAVYSSVVLIGLGLPFGLVALWRHYRSNATAFALAGGALAFPASQALRLTQGGAEVADRATEFLFLGVAFILSIGIIKFWLSRSASWRRSALFVAMVIVVFIGQTIVDAGPPWALLPGPYLVSSDQRSIDMQGVNAAEWTGLYLGSGHRIASDRVNTLLLSVYGDEQVFTGGSAQVSVSWVFLAPQVGPGVVGILKQDKIQYLLIDRRLSTGLPEIGTYFNNGEPNAQHYTRPISVASLTKFNGLDNVSKVFDSGDIVIYEVGGLMLPTSISPTPPLKPCVPTASTAVSSYPKVATLYTGTYYDIPTGLVANISLRGVQQKRGGICGYFKGVGGYGPFQGTITSTGQIHLVVTSNANEAPLSFDGFFHPDGTINGSFCHGTIAGKCRYYGIWSLSPGE